MAGHFKAVLGIRDILVRIRGSAPLTNGSGSNSGCTISVPTSFREKGRIRSRVRTSDKWIRIPNTASKKTMSRNRVPNLGT